MKAWKWAHPHLLTTVTLWVTLMIKTFGHKGLEEFFNEGSMRGIQPKHAKKLTFILDQLDTACTARDMDYDGSNLHPLKGDLDGFWAVKVSGNWRVTFRFENGNAYVVDYLDYH